jgi:N-acyl-D-amino-acid deacylase
MPNIQSHRFLTAPRALVRLVRARTSVAVAIALAATFVGCTSVPVQQSPATDAPFDLLIRNGRVVDGSGNPWFRADVGIRAGKVAAIGRLDGARANKTLDAGNKIVAPGFIDVHTHIEMNIEATPTADNFVQGGVTTVITGNCGGSAPSVAAFLGRFDSAPPSINVATFIGHNTVRREVLGLSNQPASAEQLQRMQLLVERGMKDGAVGLSTGLIYLPGLYSNTDEVVALAKAAARFGGVYASHIRNESNKVTDAIEEALAVGRAANMPVQISHFKVSAPANWGRSKDTLAMIEAARRAGQDVTIDQYPYTASSTSLSVMLPDWAVEGGDADIRKRIADPKQRAMILEDLRQTIARGKRRDMGYAVVARFGANPAYNGKSIREINVEKGREDTIEAGLLTVLDLLSEGGAQMVFHGMDEDDVKRIMAYPFNMIASDGGVQNGRGVPHPRSYGTNARVLAKYVREEKIISLEEAIRRMTSLPAQRFQLQGRGLLREGFAADIVIFDENTVADRATFKEPHQFAAGFDAVLVNGVVTVQAGKHTGAAAGKGLRGPAAAGAFPS